MTLEEAKRYTESLEKNNCTIKNAEDVEGKITKDILMTINREIERLYREFDDQKIVLDDMENAMRKLTKKYNEMKTFFSDMWMEVNCLHSYRTILENILSCERVIEAYEIIKKAEDERGVCAKE